jgi:hypothetical protein
MQDLVGKGLAMEGLAPMKSWKLDNKGSVS